MKEIKIGENSSISMWAVVVVTGGAFWLTMVYANGLQNTHDISSISQDRKDARAEQKQVNKELVEKVQDLKAHVENLEGQVQFLVDRAKREKN
jgi:cell division protein FtsB